MRRPIAMWLRFSTAWLAKAWFSAGSARRSAHASIQASPTILGPGLSAAMRIGGGGGVARGEYIIGDGGVDRKAAIGGTERLFLRLDAAVPKQGVEIQHLMRRFVDDLAREQVFDRGREVVHLQPLAPAAIDVIEHPLQDPEAAEQAADRGLVHGRPARRRADIFPRRGRGALP